MEQDELNQTERIVQLLSTNLTTSLSQYFHSNTGFIVASSNTT
jgi:hypothetical protein